METREKVRTSVVSGQFYPDDPQILRNQIKGFFARSSSSPQEDVCALIVPHAGYDYSGQVAADAYRLIEARKFESVVVIAFLHRMYLRGVLVDDVEAYETPLGRVPVDRERVREIQACDPLFRNTVPGQIEEHSLEVQIPFLQMTVPQLKIVPVYIGVQDITNITVLAGALAKTCENRNTLVVATTDLSHFYPYELAVKKDTALIKKFEEGNAEALYDSYVKEESEACGMAPVLSLIQLARRLGWNGPRLIRYMNSGDVTGDKKSVVGYAAMAFKNSLE